TGRAAIVPVSLLCGYARAAGAGDGVSPGASSAEIALASLTALAFCLIFGMAGLLAFALAAAAAWIILRLLLRRLGGYTGDGLGAIEQAAEITVLITLAGACA
ncbi:MAG: adenosylcobinamide-GDP ribazoletransferase, partial [Pseudomonadota bacterium]